MFYKMRSKCFCLTNKSFSYQIFLLQLSTTLELFRPIEMQPPTPPADAFLMVNHTSLTVRWLPPHSEYGTKIRQYRLDIYQGEVLQSFLVDSKGRNFTLIPFGTSFVSCLI